jgi:hypothetical protein
MEDVRDEHISKLAVWNGLLSGFSAFSLSEEIEIICPEARHDLILAHS